jgi:hypothetical protein
VKLVDGTTFTISDTKENRKKYPKRKNIFGFPLMRLVGIISLATGSLMDLETASHMGKGTGETSLFIRFFQKSKAIQEGDVLLMDSLYCTYLILTLCATRKIDLVVRQAGTMKSEKLKTVRILGKGDRLVELYRTKTGKSSPQDKKLIAQTPETLIIREITHHFKIPGFRPKKTVLLTTFLDSQTYTKKELVELYYQRWNCELDLRNINAF